MNKQEITFVIVLLSILWTAATLNLLSAQVLARDVQRKNDLRHIATALELYRKDVRAFPSEKDGKMLACEPYDNLKACNWGSDPLASTASAYINPLPEDPLEYKNESSYLYISNGRDFQLFAALEKKEDDEVNQKIINRNFLCGDKVCNFGVGSISTEIDLSTYKYE